MTSREITVGVASGQFISNCPRLTAVCIAIACLLSRNWPWDTHPATASAARSTKSNQALHSSVAVLGKFSYDTTSLGKKISLGTALA